MNKSIIMGTAFDLPPSQHIYEIVATQACHSGESVAIVHHNVHTTYAGLQAHVERYKTLLQKHVLPGRLVFVQTSDATVHYVASLLAINALQGIFVPIDEHLLTVSGLEILRDLGLVLRVDDEGAIEVISPTTTEFVEYVDCTYGFFTSGSTGKPKLAVNTSKGLENRFSWMTRTFATKDLVTLQTTRHTFDSSLWQLLWPLTIGGLAVIPARYNGLIDRVELLNLINRHKVTIVDFVPSILNSYLSTNESVKGFQQLGQSLRDVIVGGEAFLYQDGNKLMEVLPNTRLWNLYGPTEAAIGSVYQQLSYPLSADVELGTPIQNTGVCVISENAEIVDCNVEGEIALLGDCVGYGYVKNNTLTQDRFFERENFGQVIRGYKTGDIGKITSDGKLVYLGRQSRIVKFAGQWVDLSKYEIETRNILNANRVAAIIANGKEGSEHLVLFTDLACNESEQYALLRKIKLNQIPSRIFTKTEYVADKSGKLNYKILGELATELLGEMHNAPDSKLDGVPVIEQCWKAILGKEVIRDATFFEQGGTSLQVLQIIELLKRETGLNFKPIDLFRNPTLDRFSKFSKELSRQEASCEK